jgi:hypothetical protein
MRERGGCGYASDQLACAHPPTTLPNLVSTSPGRLKATPLLTAWPRRLAARVTNATAGHVSLTSHDARLTDAVVMSCTSH